MISAHFSRKEFACKCGCGFDAVDVGLIQVLEDLREHFNRPITITSGCRCEDHNKSIGGSINSQHTKGKAADIKIEGIEPSEVYEYLDIEHPTSLGVGKYNWWTHVDSRDAKARWDKT